MQIVNSRYNQKYIVWLFAALSISFLLSLVTLQLFAAILVILYLTEKFENKKIAFGKIEIAFSIFILARIISILFSDFPQASNQAFYKDALYILGFYAFGFYFRILNIDSIIKVVNIFINSAVAVSIVGILFFVTSTKDRAASVVSGYATFSGYLLCAFAILLSVKFFEKRKFDWIIFSAKAAILLTGIVLALGRGDFAVAIVIFILAILLRKIKIKEFAFIVILTSIISVISFSVNTKEISGRVENPTGYSDRNILWSRAYELSCENPVLGFGPRTFKNIFLKENKLTDKHVASWHNDYITIYLESGALGILSFLILISIIYYYGIRSIIKNDKNKFSFNLILGTLLALTSIFMSAFLSGFINNPILSVLFAFLLALFSSLHFKDSKLFFTPENLNQ